MIPTKKKKVLNICETCLQSFDDYSVAWVDRGGYCSLHCDGCINDYDMVVSKRMKERKVKEPKIKEKKPKKVTKK